MITVTVCVGSSCHIKGARDLIARFNDFITEEGIEDKVELKGSFCMELCGEGVNWTIDDETVSSPSVEDGLKVLREKIGCALKTRTSKKARKKAPGKRKPE